MAIPPASFLKYDFSDPACYPGSGTTITDLSTNLDGSTTGSPTYVSDGQQSYFSIVSDSQKVWSNGYNFPAKNIYTISAIFQVSAQNNYNTVLALAQNNGNGTTPFINVPFNHTAEYNSPGSSNGFGVGTITGNLKLQNDTWNLLVLTADGTTQKVYLNGILVGSVAHTNSFNGSAAKLQTGYPDFIGDFAIQKIAIMQMWESALTATQVLDLAESYRTRFSLYQPVNSYDFSVSQSYPGSGTSVFDLAGSLTLPIVNATYAGTGTSKYFSFDGNGDYIGTTSVTGLGDTFSVNIWYEPTAVNATVRNLWQVGVGTTGTNPGVILNSPSTSDLTSTFNGIGQTQATGVLTANTWQMATVTADGSTHKIYIDGVLDASVSQGIGEWATGGFAIGAGVDGSGNISAGADGLLGNVAVFDVYNSALGSTDITNIYNETETRFFPPAPPSPVLIGSYDFSDPLCYPGTGTTVFDLTANNNDLVMNGSGAQPSYGGTGQSKAFSFLNDNLNGLYCSQFSALGTTFGGTSFTLSAWHNYDNAQQDNAAILFGGNGANNDGVTIQVTGNDGNKIYGGIFGSSAAVGIANTANTWHMSTYTGDGTTLKIYQDGALIGSTSQNGSWNGRAFVLGRYLDASYNPVGTGNQFRYAGLIGIAEVYSGALGSTDISDLYDLQQPRFYPAPPPPPTPISELDFSDLACYPGSGTTVFDLVSNNDFSITSGATFVSDGQASYFQFAGSGNRLQTISPVTVTSQTVFTFSAWAMNTGTTSTGILFASGLDNPSGGVPCIAINVTAPDVVISTYGFGVGTAVGTAINENEWYLLTMTCDGTTNKIYINDTLAGSGSRSTGSIFNNPTDLVIGQYSTTNLTIPWIGRVATYSYYDEALSLEDIQNLYNSTSNRFSTPIVSIVGGRQFAQGFNG